MHQCRKWGTLPKHPQQPGGHRLFQHLLETAASAACPCSGTSQRSSSLGLQNLAHIPTATSHTPLLAFISCTQGYPVSGFLRKPTPPSLLADLGCPWVGSSSPFPQQQLHQNGSQSGGTKSVRGFQGSRIRPTLFRAEKEVSFISVSVFSQG